MSKKARSYQRGSPENLYDAVDFIRATTVTHINHDLVARIRAEVGSGRPIRIGFLVSDQSKWNADSLLDEMRQAGWSTRLYLCLKKVKYADREDKIRTYEAEREFFTRIDKDLIELYDPERDLETPVEDAIAVDVLFLQQPWGMKDFPRRLVGRCLNVYMHYGFILMANHGMHYNVAGFHSYLWRYFSQTEEHRVLHLKHDPAAYDKLVVTGYPKLDVYLSEPGDQASGLWPIAERSVTRVIYAPHHSLEKDSLRMATFPWTYQYMLELATNTPNIQWVYKPHPNLKYNVARSKVMTRDEYHRYENAWSSLPNATVYDSGGYFDLFRSSDAMITDCGSFLAEYLPTGRPIIWLVSPDSVGFNQVGDLLAESFYKVRSTAELSAVFTNVVANQQDPLREERIRATQRLFPTEGRAATAVVEHIRQQLQP